MSNDWSEEATDDPLYADGHNFYKVEKWTKDGTRTRCRRPLQRNPPKAEAKSEYWLLPRWALLR